MDRAQKSEFSVARLKANYYKARFGLPIFRYLMEFEPEIPNVQHELIDEVSRKMRSELEEVYGKHFIRMSSVILSPLTIEGTQEKHVEYDGVKYRIKITQTGVIRLDTMNPTAEAIQVAGRLFKICQHRLNYKLINRKYFNPEFRTENKAMRVQIWPGYATSFKFQPTIGFVANIDCSFKIIRQDGVYSLIDTIRQNSRSKEEAERKIKDELIGTSVMTT